MKNKKNVICLGALLFLCTACSQNNETPDSSAPSDFKQPSTLTICLGEEPDSLYPFAVNNQAAQIVQQAIFDGPIDFLGNQSSPIILENIPNLSDGSAFISKKWVKAGDEVIDSKGNLVELHEGIEVYPSGCRSFSCTLVWDGISQLEMDVTTAKFKIRSGVLWSDGQSMQASDSEFSFFIASDQATQSNKKLIDHTTTYYALDHQTIEWISKPGLVTDEFGKYFWHPIPKHLWGNFSAVELRLSKETNRYPIGWGAYKIAEWVEGEYLRLERNPYYFRKEEGLPYFDTAIFKIINPTGDAALSNVKFDRTPYQQFNYDVGEYESEINENGCDLTTITSEMRDQLPVLNILQNYFKEPAIKIASGTSEISELLFFNLRDNANEPINRLNNIEVRKAVSQCINREKIIQDLSFGIFQMPNGKLISNHEDGIRNNLYFEFDPESGKDILEKNGWLDHDNDLKTPRTMLSNKEKLEFLYLIENSNDNLKAAELIKESLKECGVGLNIKVVPSEIFWDFTHKDSIFQGSYDMAQVSMPAPIENVCLLFASQFISSDKNNFHGTNFSGFNLPEFDKACEHLQVTQQNSEKNTLLEELEKIFNQEIPAVPLYSYSKIIVAQKYFCIEELDDKFINIERFRISDDCS